MHTSISLGLSDFLRTRGSSNPPLIHRIADKTYSRKLVFEEAHNYT